MIFGKFLIKSQVKTTNFQPENLQFYVFEI